MRFPKMSLRRRPEGGGASPSRLVNSQVSTNLSWLLALPPLTQDNAALKEHAERIIAKAWADDAFKARLLADPAAVAAAEGTAVPAGVKIVVHENKAGELHFVLPELSREEISDGALEAVVGGKYQGRYAGD